MSRKSRKGERPRPWTADEDSALRRWYAKRPEHRVRSVILATLPGRTWRSIVVRASVMRLGCAKRRWTREEDAALRVHWPDSSVATIRKALRGRSWESIYHRAILTLRLGPRFAGYVSVQEAAARCGCASAMVRDACRAAGVRVQIIGGRVRRDGAPHLAVEWDAARDAVIAWTTRETIANGARRHGVRTHTLRAWLIEAGHYKPVRKGARARLEPAVVDRVVSAHRGVVELQRSAA